MDVSFPASAFTLAYDVLHERRRLRAVYSERYKRDIEIGSYVGCLWYFSG